MNIYFILIAFAIWLVNEDNGWRTKSKLQIVIPFENVNLLFLITSSILPLFLEVQFRP